MGCDKRTGQTAGKPPYVLNADNSVSPLTAQSPIQRLWHFGSPCYHGSICSASVVPRLHELDMPEVELGELFPPSPEGVSSSRKLSPVASGSRGPSPVASGSKPVSPQPEPIKLQDEDDEDGGDLVREIQSSQGETLLINWRSSSVTRTMRSSHPQFEATGMQLPRPRQIHLVRVGPRHL